MHSVSGLIFGSPRAMTMKRSRQTDEVLFDVFPKVGDDLNNKFWRGLDGRFNHMCLSNHGILAARIAESLINGTALDLKQGFIQKIIPADWESNIEFQDRELDAEIARKNLEHKKSYGPILPWKKRIGITTNNK
jgi:hypothetical protein